MSYGKELTGIYEVCQVHAWSYGNWLSGMYEVCQVHARTSSFCQVEKLD